MAVVLCSSDRQKAGRAGGLAAATWARTPEGRAAKARAGRLGGLRGGLACKNNPRHRAALQAYARTPEGREQHRRNGQTTALKLAGRRRLTALEFALRRLLFAAGFQFLEQEPLAGYVVDAWVPSHALVFEADGPWHAWNENQGPARCAQRDARLVANGAAAVIHLSADDLIPWLATGPEWWRFD